MKRRQKVRKRRDPEPTEHKLIKVARCRWASIQCHISARL